MTSATLTWLNTFDLEGKLLEQLVALKGRISAGFGRGLFSGKQQLRFDTVQGVARVLATCHHAEGVYTVHNVCVQVCPYCVSSCSHCFPVSRLAAALRKPWLQRRWDHRP